MLYSPKFIDSLVLITVALSDVIKVVDARLVQGTDGAAGWWPITRVHLDPGSLYDCVKYLADLGADYDFIPLTAANYVQLGKIVGNETADPRVGLNRHQLLALYQPLGILERENPNRVSPTRLTEAGRALASTAKPEAVFEQQLSKIIFCRQPYYTADREAQYNDFNVPIYPAALTVMKAVEGWIDRDEFDLFVSRLRSPAEANWSIAGVRQFRQLTPDERHAVLTRVQLHGPLTPKVYQNWRDMGPHVFSLFALGTSAVRLGNVLSLASVAAKPELDDKAGAPKKELEKPVPPNKEKVKVLRIPEPPASADVDTAPPPPIPNDGRGAEIFVGKLMAATGWRVVYYGHRRGYGFDIWATKGNAVLYVEVKSCTGNASSVSFTPTEMQAAKQYGKNFLLVIVENAATTQQFCWAIQDPANKLDIKVQKTESHVVPAKQWRKVAKAMNG